MFKRKGQYMAVEAVLSLGLSLIVAVAAIGVFQAYRGEVINAIEDRHTTIIRSEVLTTVYNLREADSGSSVSISLPEPPASGEYRLGFDERELVMDTGGEEERVEVNGASWADSLSGSTTSSSVKIVKLNDDIIMRPE
jgi:hypothetical protein